MRSALMLYWPDSIACRNDSTRASSRSGPIVGGTLASHRAASVIETLSELPGAAADDACSVPVPGRRGGAVWPESGAPMPPLFKLSMRVVMRMPLQGGLDHAGGAHHAFDDALGAQVLDTNAVGLTPVGEGDAAHAHFDAGHARQ